MESLKAVKAWSMIMDAVRRVRDDKLKTALLQEYRVRAKRCWGWVPDGTEVDDNTPPEMSEDEKELHKAIMAAIKFGIDIHEEERPQKQHEFECNMAQFILDGGSLSDIPEDIRTKEVTDTYYKELFRFGDNLCVCADDLLKTKKE